MAKRKTKWNCKANFFFFAPGAGSRRLCVFHGRPVSIASSEVDTELPQELKDLPTSSRHNTMPNILAMIKLTEFLEDSRDAM